MAQTAVGCIDERIGVNLPLYEFGLMTAADKDQFENHMIECTPCAEEVARMALPWALVRAHPDVLTQPGRYIEKTSFLSHLSGFSLKPMMAMAAAALLFFAIGVSQWNAPDPWRVASRMEINEPLAGHRGADGTVAGLQALQAGHLEKAEASFHTAAREDAHDYRAQYYLGVCRRAAAESGWLGWKKYDVHRLQGAIAAFRQAAVLAETADPVYLAQAYLSLAEAYARSGDRARAREALQKVDRVDADDPVMTKIRQSAAALRAEWR